MLMRRRALDFLFVLVGVGFSAKLIIEYDLAAIWRDVCRVGWNAGWLLLLWALMVAADTATWHYCLGAAKGRVGLLKLGMLTLAGQAVNNVTPSGNLGEVVKGKYLAQDIGTSASVSGVVIYNFMYGVVSALMLLASTICSIFIPQVPRYLVILLLLSTAIISGYVLLLAFILRAGFSEKLIRFLRRLRLPMKNSERWIQGAQRIDLQLREFGTRYPRDLFATLVLVVASRLISVLEAWVICFALQRPIGFDTALFITAVSQIISWVFAMVPSQIGVAEQGSDALFMAMAYQPGTGFTFELVRRARKLLQVALGLAILLYLSLRDRRTLPAAAQAPVP
jgi:uncharacterized protein (TIRG00374 family)